MAGKGQPGPAPKLTDEVRAEIAAKLVSGCTLEDAAVSVGVTRVTIQRWLAIGRQAAEAELAGKRLTERQRNFLELVRAEQGARAELRVKLLTTTQVAASRGDWKAAAWLLERLYPEDFAPKRGSSSRAGTGRPVGSSSAPDRTARPERQKPRPGVLRAVS